MSDNTSGESNSGLYFIVGGLVVAVAMGAFAYYEGYFGGHGSSSTTQQTTISAPAPDGATTTTTTTTDKTK
jgi:F0F1-type ATP synthase membrane subunit c/vacuolar-type H+-ATPase subunit K